MDIEVLGIEEKGRVSKTARYSESSLVSREIGGSPLFITVDFDFKDDGINLMTLGQKFFAVFQTEDLRIFSSAGLSSV